MFKWDESINSIDVSANKVVHLFRSMREVQLALPGIPAQQASAYLCQYKQPEGIATVAAFHLNKGRILAFYCSDPRVVPEQKMDNMLDQGLNFVESMGFLLTDQDIHLLDDSDQQMLWESLPLKAGLDVETASSEPTQTKQSVMITVEKPAVSRVDPSSTSAKNKPVVETVASSKPATKQSPVAEPVRESEPKAPEEDVPAENVDDLLAAVEAMRAKRPGLRSRTTAPSAAEMDRRKEQLRETVGRILVSL